MPAPLDSLSRETCRSIRIVLCDIDDTLTLHGRLPAIAYGGLERLREAGRRVIPVTGRPGGWCDHIARMWPVAAIVGENGALYFRYDREARRMIRRFVRCAAQRAEDAGRMEDLKTSILEAVPGAALASDQPYRDTDLAIDFCEDVPRLPQPQIRKIVALFKEAGATAKISSIHVNGWFGDYDKLTTTRRMLAEMFDFDIDARNREVVFLGDSPNDAPMFKFFENSIGVANVADFFGQITDEPRYITKNPGGRGFAEFVDHLLGA